MLATIEITFDSREDAERVRKAVDPDNSPIPEGIMVDTDTIENCLKIIIHCNRGIDSFRATIEDIMSAVDLAIRTAQSVK